MHTPSAPELRSSSGALACIPAAISADERAEHFELARQLLSSRALERQELEHGYAWRFDAGALSPLARFIANERKCCPFLDFELQVGAGSAFVWLRMTGPAGTQELLRAELGLPGPCVCCNNGASNASA